MLRSTSPVDEKFRADYEFAGIVAAARKPSQCLLVGGSSFFVNPRVLVVSLYHHEFVSRTETTSSGYCHFTKNEEPPSAHLQFPHMSSDFVPFPPPPPTEALYLVGFRLDPDAEGPQFYTLFVLDSENDRPLIANGRVVFFADPAHASEALELADNDMSRLGPAPRELEVLCDIAESLHIANAQDTDTDGILLETIALFDDLIRAIEISVPAQYMSVLSALSERLATTPEFATMFAETGIDRETLEDALMWCVGAVAVKSRFL